MVDIEKLLAGIPGLDDPLPGPKTPLQQNNRSYLHLRLSDVDDTIGLYCYVRGALEATDFKTPVRDDIMEVRGSLPDISSRLQELFERKGIYYLKDPLQLFIPGQNVVSFKLTRLNDDAEARRLETVVLGIVSHLQGITPEYQIRGYR
jgi:hypothetical protein